MVKDNVMLYITTKAGLLLLCLRGAINYRSQLLKSAHLCVLTERERNHLLPFLAPVGMCMISNMLSDQDR